MTEKSDTIIPEAEPIPALSSTQLSAFDINSLSSLDISSLTYNLPAGATGSSGSYLYSTAGANGTSAYNWNNVTVSTIGSTTSAGGLHVKSDAEFEGDIKWKGRSLEKLLEKIEDRLAILQDPDPAKLEKHAALKKAYDHYKLLEKLIGDD